MGYEKNRWTSKNGYRKVDGKVYFPVENKKILAGSKLTCLSLDPQKTEEIRIYGEFELSIGDEIINSSEIIDEYQEYLEGQIIGQELNYAYMDHRGDLFLEIASAIPIKIYVDSSIMEFPIDKWMYVHEGGYVMN